MKTFFYVVIAGLLAVAGYMTYDRFSGPSAEDNTLAQAQGVPPPPARLPGAPTQPQEPAAAAPTETVVQEVIQQEAPEAAPAPQEAAPSPSYAPDANAGQPSANRDADGGSDTGGFCAEYPDSAECNGSDR